MTDVSQVDRRTTVPVRAVILITVCSAAIGLINIGSTTAFNDVVSLVFEAFYVSYLITCGLLLYRRLKGQIGEADLDGMPSSSAPYTWGPWRLPGWTGTLNNVFAVIYLVIMTFFGFFPTAPEVTPDTMNYSVLVLGAVVIFSLIYYFVGARKTYQGPTVEVKLHEI